MRRTRRLKRGGRREVKARKFRITKLRCASGVRWQRRNRLSPIGQKMMMRGSRTDHVKA